MNRRVCWLVCSLVCVCLLVCSLTRVGAEYVENGWIQGIGSNRPPIENGMYYIANRMVTSLLTSLDPERSRS